MADPTSLLNREKFPVSREFRDRRRWGATTPARVLLLFAAFQDRNRGRSNAWSWSLLLSPAPAREASPEKRWFLLGCAIGSV